MVVLVAIERSSVSVSHCTSRALSVRAPVKGRMLESCERLSN